jgi:hypothetical protein
VNTKYCCEDPPRRRRRNAHRVTVHGSRQQRRVLIGTIEHDEPLARAMHAPDGPLMVGTPTCPYRRSSPRRAVSTCRIGPECGVQYCSVRDRVLPPFSFLSTCSEDPKHAARGGRVPWALHPALADTRSSTRLPSPHWATSPPSITPSTSQRPRPRRRVPLLQMRGLQGRTSSCLETCSEKGTQKSERLAARTPGAIDRSADAELALSSRPPRPQPAPAPHAKGGDAR